MPLSEFGLIARYFARRGVERSDVSLGVGDDCALLRVPAGHELAVTIDTLVAGRHFPEETDPRAIGHKAIAVNLSDLAAMGAEPAWATLSLSLPLANEPWLEAFSAGLFELADFYGVQLVGGDTVSGPLVITLQLHGFVPEGEGLRRDGANPGDLVFVTGTLGDAGAGLGIVQGRYFTQDEALRERLRQRLDFPSPRIEAGLSLRGVASAAVDISDGLAADLGHILEASGTGATIRAHQLPLSLDLIDIVGEQEAIELALTAGDDFELCFTVPPEKQTALADLGIPCTCIGVIEESPGLRILDESGALLTVSRAGFDHFRKG